MNILNDYDTAAAYTSHLNFGTSISYNENMIPIRANAGNVIVERDTSGKPHRGKVFAVIQAHMDDVPLYCSGTCTKLIKEGYTGYLVRTSNDDKCSNERTANNILSSERENKKVAETIGFSDVFDLYYDNYRLNGRSPIDISGRLIFILRYIKADMVISINPWGLGEKNPDHWVTARAVEEASWMAGIKNNYGEHILGGIEPHIVSEQYYMTVHPGQPFNRVVDIGSTIEQKIDAITACKSRGTGSLGSMLKSKLSREGKRLPILGDSDDTADRAYVKEFIMPEYSSFDGIRQHGLEYAERFYYLDNRKPDRVLKVEEYIKQHTVKM
ncbi:PIG-L deacetylase family protein [Candidatus Latescibacterota bacterium]